MAPDTSKLGQRWPEFEYEVGREKIREYANAVGEDNPVHHEREPAREAGFRDVVAPPMFAVVYSAGAVGPAVIEVIGANLGRMLHGSQEFVWAEPVCAGDAITTICEFKEAFEKSGNDFYVFESTSTNQDGQEVTRATWTNIVRGG
jgi:acyl dehydratase